MKKVKMVKCYGIYEQSEREIKNYTNHSTSKYLLFSPSEMEQPLGFRNIEIDADNIQELIDFIYTDEDTVINCVGTQISYSAAVQYMDEEIREELHLDLVPYSNQEFFSAYEKVHEEKYDFPWELSNRSPIM